ncbi:MAG: type II secretion system protein [Parcubacteria group bacterium]|nr:type II secretion system protein [Parcubacteria group bacterium]
MKNMKKGFTLIELLIVIGILAILATVAVLIINPAELLAQARDTQRISDLGTVNAAIGLYLATVSTTDLTDNDLNCSSSNVNGVCTARFATEDATTVPASYPAIDGTGWVRIDFSGITGGSPLATLPVDPVNDATYFYAYIATDATTKYMLSSNLESTRYSAGGTDDRESADGLDNDFYELGSSLAL